MSGPRPRSTRLIEDLAREGRAIIVVSSDLPEVLRLSDRALVIRRGELAGIVERRDLNEESLMRPRHLTSKFERRHDPPTPTDR